MHGHISHVLYTAWLASEYGLQNSLGSTTCEIGVQLATALAEVECLENSLIGWNVLVAKPVQFEHGYAVAPDRPGHRLTISDAARPEFASPDSV